jgi:hypothetical protein
VDQSALFNSERLRLLVISDQHNSEQGLLWVHTLIREYSPDIVIHLGDIISTRPASFARETLRSLVSANIPVLVIPGNNDPRENLPDIAKSGAVSLHENFFEFGGVKFVGRGGSNPTPFNTVFEEDDDSMAASISSLVAPGDVWCLHAPVYGFRDRVPSGEHMGVKSFRSLLNSARPWVVLSGHIHDDWGIDVYKGTHFINPGALLEMRAAIVDLTRPLVAVHFLHA